MSCETTDYAANATLNYLLRSGTVYMAIGTGATATGLTGEKSSNGYARQAITFSAAASRSTANTNTVTFGPNTSVDWGTCSHMGIYDALTNGNCLYAGNLTVSQTVAVGNVLEVAIGGVTVSEAAYAD